MEPWRTQFRGVFLRKLTRAGQEIPITLTTQLDRGDLLSLVGAKRDVDRAVAALGYADWPTTATDMIFRRQRASCLAGSSACLL